jgi:hypothetical protein
MYRKSKQHCSTDDAGLVPFVATSGILSLGGSYVYKMALIMASGTLAVSAPRRSPAGLEVSSLRGHQRDAEGSQVAQTVSKAHDLLPRFWHGEACWKDTCSGPFPHRRGRPLCMGAAAQCRGDGPKTRTGSSPYDRFERNVKATFVEVLRGLEHGVGPPSSH